MIKIAVVGAGVGGVVCAFYLARNGYDVTVYERCSLDDVTYSWHDDIAVESFKDIGLGMPPENLYYPKRNWTFVPPLSTMHVYAGLPQPTDVSISRRGLLHWLVAQAQAEGARFVFEKEASLWVEDDLVVGLTVDDQNIPYALVVDNAGVDSAIRRALPPSCGIRREAYRDEVFCAYRAFYRRREGVTVADNETNRVYLLHEGGKGISWCIADPTQPTVDVLIGRLGDLGEDTLATLLAKLREDNPILTDELTSGGAVYRIPVRHPAWRMVADGYASLGDSAFMTIPMLGSGMAAGMVAGRILAETVVDRQSVSKEALWHYQVAYYDFCGAEHCGVDVMKRWLLSADPADVRWLFESGVLSADNINAGAAGENIKLRFGELVQKGVKGRKRLGLLLKLSGLLGDCAKAVRLARRIPRVYDPAEIEAWQAKMEALYQ